MTDGRIPRATIDCFGCGKVIPAEIGVYYCDECVEKQAREYGSELAAYDAYHRFADECARRSR